MRPSILVLSLLPLLFGHALSLAQNFDLVGYAKDNPLGPTTGGLGGEIVTVNDTKSLKSAVKGDTPRIIHLSGTFNLTSRLQIGSNKTLLGLGPGAEILTNGLTLKSVSNVIIRNLGIRFILSNDAITIQNSTRVWIDHNEFESSLADGPDKYDGQCDIVRASDWITVSWNYFHDHWKSSLVGNKDSLRDVDTGHLHVTYHHNHWRNAGTRGPAGRFGHQHVYNNLYEDFRYQAIHSRSDNQVLVEGNVFRGQMREALSTYGLVIPDDSPNTSPEGDWEIDGFANLGVENDWGGAGVNVTQTGNFTETGYGYGITALGEVEGVVREGAGLGKVGNWTGFG
ncbi:pectin lyase-like protein [Polyplosphaeria fusca]|uniref:Pectin lyase-like protein n=1 Tax=Polyplosphaeria fusca TaxID=682080 RepID=A0A9P4QIR6_9PLEO|nr:pectin lyase-like protein [Polyplosphaeria fusca]